MSRRCRGTLNDFIKDKNMKIRAYFGAIISRRAVYLINDNRIIYRNTCVCPIADKKESFLMNELGKWALVNGARRCGMIKKLVQDALNSWRVRREQLFRLIRHDRDCWQENKLTFCSCNYLAGLVNNLWSTAIGLFSIYIAVHLSSTSECTRKCEAHEIEWESEFSFQHTTKHSHCTFNAAFIVITDDYFHISSR